MTAAPLSLERYRNGIRIVYNLLKEEPDGLTSYHIARITGLPRSTVYIILNDNPLFYIDRWEVARNKSMASIWVNAEINNPGDCPKPSIKEDQV